MSTLARRAPALPAPLASTLEQARGYAQKAKADNTRRAYRADWQSFAEYCEAHGLRALPAEPQTLALYAVDRATGGYKVASIVRALAAISQAHRAAGHPSPRSSFEVQQVLQGIKNTHGVAQDQKKPTVAADIRAMAAALSGDSLLDTRDRALILVGFAGAFRRSELVSLNEGDVAIDRAGLRITLRRSKTDQEGAGRTVGVPFGRHEATCPVRAYKAWIATKKTTRSLRDDGGAIFVGISRHGVLTGKRLSGWDVARTVKRLAAAAGLVDLQLDPNVLAFSGHSLRAGLVTTAAQAGKEERAIMNQTGHASTTMVRRYIRDANVFSDNAADDIGL